MDAHRILSAGLFGALVLSGCAAPGSSPEAGRPPAPAQEPKSVAVAPAVPAAIPQPPPPRVEKAPTTPAPATTPAPKPKPPAAAKPAPAAAPAPVAAAPVAPPRPAEPPPLDLGTLEQRLKATEAIGVLTKLSLKNQVDDIIGRFKAFHAGQRPPTLAELKPAFNLLLMKVLSLLQDKDAALARDIDRSRDAIWGVLVDRDKLSRYASR